MKPVLFSVSYAGLWGQHTLDVEAFIKKAAQLGYSAVELMAKRPHLSILDTDEEMIERIKHCAKENNVEISTVAGYTDFTAGKSSEEVPFVEMQILYIQSLANIAMKLGAKIVRVFTGYSTDETAYSDDWNKCVKAIRESAAVAEDYGICLGLQNHHDTAISTEAYIEFLNDVDHPNCKAMYDPWVPAFHGEDLYEVAKIMAPRMVQTTLADYIRLKRWVYIPKLVNYREMPEMVRAVSVGNGFIQFESFFRGLREAEFKGYVAYEMCSPVRGGGCEENLDKTALESLNKIKALIKG